MTGKIIVDYTDVNLIHLNTKIPMNTENKSDFKFEVMLSQITQLNSLLELQIEQLVDYGELMTRKF